MRPIARHLARGITLSILWSAGVAAQAPQGGSVAAGTASISAAPGRTTIRQGSDHAVLDWRSFDVGRDHGVVFEQPGRSAATLNRVHSGRESTIAGAVAAPGTVIIQNTSGVVFTGTARVDVGGIVAASQRVDADRFQRTGALAIGGGEAPGARVVNHGTLTVRDAGLAALVGGRVENAGTITARRGTVALVSGAATTIDLAGDGLIRIAVDGNAARQDPRVANSGLIDAPGGHVLLSAGAAAAAVEGVVNTSGVIRAGNARGAGGRIELVGRDGANVQVSGQLLASGATRGGSVTVTGAAVQVGSGARIAARGRDSGGDIRIGGDRQGAGPLRNATKTTIAAGAVLDATATQGRGGSAIVWADGDTIVDGSIRTGGPAGGGFIETSGRERLHIGLGASVDAGFGGTWLLDPRNVEIAGAAGFSVPPGGGTVDPPAGAGPFLINAATIVTALNAGNSVIITTTQAAGTDPGDLTVLAGGAINWTGAGSLTLQADRSVQLNDQVRGTGTGSLTITALTGNIAATAAPSVNKIIGTVSGDLVLSAPLGSILLGRTTGAVANLQITSTSGDVTLTAGQEVRVFGGTGGGSWTRVGNTTGTVSVTAPVIAVQGGRGSNSFAEVLGAAGSTVLLRASTSITLTGGSNVTGTASPARVAGAAGASVTLESPSITVRGGTGLGGSAAVTANGGPLTMAATGAITLAPGTGPGASAFVSALNDSALTMSAPTQSWGGTVTVNGSGATLGGTTQLAGLITATVAPTFNLSPARNFTLGLVPGFAGPSAFTGNGVPLQVTTRGTGTIDVNGPVSATTVTLISAEGVRLRSTLTASAPGDALVVAAGRRFTNDVGPGVFSVTDPAARSLLYIDSFAGQVGALPTTPAGSDLYNRPYPANLPPSLAGFPGNRVVWGEQPTLTLTAETLSKTFGTAVVPGFTEAGLRPGDTLGGALATGPTVSSAGAAATADVGLYPTTVAATASAQGYAVALTPGTLTVTPAPLAVAATDLARLYGQADPAPLPFTATGFVLGDTPATVLTGALTRAAGETVGAYAISQGSLASTTANYTIGFTPGTLTITPAPLRVTAEDATRAEATPNPPFSATFAGFVAGDTAATALGGTLVLATPATLASPPGPYPITPSGLTALNYTIAFIPGVLTVTAVTPTPPPPILPTPPVSPPVAPLPPDIPVVGDGVGVSVANAGIFTVQQLNRGVAPATPGDATFRTTVLEVPIAASDPFRLTYSLSGVIQLLSAEDQIGAAGCGGLVNLGTPERCTPTRVDEGFWSPSGLGRVLP